MIDLSACLVVLSLLQVDSQRVNTRAPSVETDRSLEAVGREAQFIFKGKVEKLGASNVKTLPPTSRTVVVRVQEVLEAPKSTGDFKNEEITVRLAKPDSIKKGEEVIFFADALIYGEKLAVRELAHQAVPENVAALRDQIAAMHNQVADERLQARLSRASLIVVGKVTATRPVPRERKIMPRSFHEPDWWEASIQVRSVEKGQFSEKTIAVLFPNSTDVVWVNSPKFHAGQEGVWILQEDQTERGSPAFRLAGYTSLDPLDFQPMNELQRVRRLTGHQP